MRAEIDEMFMPIHYCNMKTILLHIATLVKISLYLVQGLPAVNGHAE